MIGSGESRSTGGKHEVLAEDVADGLDVRGARHRHGPARLDVRRGQRSRRWRWRWQAQGRRDRHHRRRDPHRGRRRRREPARARASSRASVDARARAGRSTSTRTAVSPAARSSSTSSTRTSARTRPATRSSRRARRTSRSSAPPALFLNNVDDMVACVDQAGAADRHPRHRGRRAPRSRSSARRRTYAREPDPQIICDTQDEHPADLPAPTSGRRRSTTRRRTARTSTVIVHRLARTSRRAETVQPQRRCTPDAGRGIEGDQAGLRDTDLGDGHRSRACTPIVQQLQGQRRRTTR